MELRKLSFLILLAVAIVIVVSRPFERNCFSVSACQCGEQCVSIENYRICPGVNCGCVPGCAVGVQFIPEGESRENPYCGRCSCLAGQHGIPNCTMSTWCEGRQYRDLYQNNTACQTQ